MQNSIVDYEALKSLLKSRLTEKRYFHSLCVAEEAKNFAIKYGCDSDKAYLAGLLHDITKNATDEEHLKIFTDFDIILNNVEKNAKKLWHAMSGAAYVKYVLKIDDAEIIDAILYHTTAKADMSFLAKILYIADFTSADRDYTDVDVIRKLAVNSLEEAFSYALKYSIKDLVDQNRAVHLNTIEAFNQLVLTKIREE